MWAEPILFEYLRFKIPVGRDQNTQFCTEHWRIWAFRCGQEQHISISSILNSFQKASKHPVFHRTLENLGFQVWAGAILFELLLFKITSGRHQNTQFCTEDWRIWTFRGGQWAGMILFEWLVTCLYIFYIECFWESLATLGFACNSRESWFTPRTERKRPFQIEDFDSTNPKLSKQDCAKNHF